MVYKYLCPKNVIVTQGLSVGDSAIKLHISYIAMMQLIDVPEHLTIHNKMCGLNRLYMAPEVKEGHSQITPKADIWSFGVILYLMIIGFVTMQMANAEAPKFNFSEPVWNSQD